MFEARKIAMRAAIIRKDLLSRHGSNSTFAHCLGLLSDEKLCQMHDAFHAGQVAYQKEKSRRRAQAGFASLIALMVCCAVMLVLAAAFLPNTIRMAQVSNNSGAASWLGQVNAGEQAYGTYGGYVQPYYLAGSIQAKVAGALPCANPMLEPGSLVGSATAPAWPSGYTGMFTPGTAASGYSCTNGPAAAYQNYSIALAPTSRLQAGDVNFYTCVGIGCDGQVHYASARDAVETDPVYTVTTATGGSGVGSGNNAATIPPPIGLYSPSATYTAGQFVYVPTTGTATPQLWLNMTGLPGGNGNPSPDIQDWAIFGSLTGGYDVNPTSPAGSGNSAANVIIPAGKCQVFPVNQEGSQVSPPASWGCSGLVNTAFASERINTVNFTVTTANAGGQQFLGPLLAFGDLTAGCGGNVSTTVPAGNQTWTANIIGLGCQIAVGDTIVVELINQNSASMTLGSVSWTTLSQ